MKPQYDNRTLTPPDPPSKRELEREEFEQAAIKYCANLEPEEVYELWQLEGWAEKHGYIKIDNDLPIHESKEFDC